jgi:superfamily II DNA or RNA helicase
MTASVVSRVLHLKVKERVFVAAPPQDVYTQILKANVFVNPKYAANEKHGYSNWKTAKTIETYECKKDGVSIPRGYLHDLSELCKREALDMFVEDFRATSPKSFPALSVKLRPYQKRAVEEALSSEQGIVVSPTGSGKSLMGLELIRQRKQRSLIIVHRSDLATQWIKVIEERLGVKAGLIGEGRFEIGDLITVAMIQTLSSREEETKKLSETFGLILVDEVHHVPSETFSEVISWMSAKYLYGLSATLNRRDGLEKIIYRCIGPVIAVVERDEVESRGNTVPLSVFAKNTGFDPGPLNSWNEYLEAITNSEERNKLIIDIAIKERAPVLILCDRIEHAERLSALLDKLGVKHVLAHGQLGASDREDAMEELKTAQITIGTTGLLGEGLDVSSWEILIMASPISSEIKLMQALGRIVRPANGKLTGVVYDLKDECGFAGNSFKNRFSIYKKHNIWVNF